MPQLPDHVATHAELRAEDRRGRGALRVIVADDHPLFRAGIVRALEEDARFDVVGQAGDGERAERLICERNPDVALVDLRMPGLDGFKLLAGLRHRDPPVAVVVLTAYTHPSLVHSAMASGAAAFVAKDNDREEILKVLVDVAAGRRRVLVAERADEILRPRLSARERGVLSMLNHGWTSEEIAMLGDMAPGAVSAHLASARRKLGAVTTDDAIAAAEAWGLLS